MFTILRKSLITLFLFTGLLLTSYSAQSQTALPDYCDEFPNIPECQVVSVSEPSILYLLGLGIIGLAITRKLRKK